ncbi:hypothetical protein, partial [Fulvimarina sp. MAC3]|uniref:hypothetical protein n=1 Tax=Fulvimarina sp. MAC3 TaxID=3148887 RepID=UPI0031FBB697
VAGGTSVTSSGAQSLQNGTIAGTLDGAGAVTVSGGTTSLTGSITNAASLSVNSGTLNETGTGSINTSGNSVTVAGGTLTTDGNGIADDEAVTVSAGTLTINGNDTIASLGQSGGTVNGNAALGVTGAFNQTGGTTGGTVDVNSASFTQSGGAIVAGGTSVTSSGAQSLQNGTIAGTLDGAGAITVSGGTTSLTGSITNAASLSVNSGALNETGTGSINTSGNSVTVAGGTLTTDGNGIADDEAVTVSAGTLTINGNDTIASLAGTGGSVVIASGQTLSTGDGTNTTYAGIISGGGGLLKQGAGGFTLAGTNTYSGPTTVNAGNLTIANGGSIISNVFNSASFTNSGTVAGGVTNNAGATAGNAGTITGVVFNAGTFASSGTIGSGVRNTGSFGNSGTVNGGLNNSGTYTQTAGSTNGGTTNTGTLNGQGAFTGQIDNNAGSFNVTGNLTADSTFNNANSAVLNVNGGNFTGMTALNNASTINIAAGRTLAAGTINNGGNVNLQGAGATLFGTGNTINNSGTVTVANGGAVIDNGAINNLATGVFNFAGSATFDSDINNNGTGPITNDGVINFNGADGSIVDVAGSPASGAGSNNDIVNRNNARLNINTSDLINIGTLTNSSLGGDGAGGAAGITIGDGGLLSASAFNNSGEFSSTGAVTTTNGFTNSGTASVRGLLNGPVTNSGTLGLTGNLSGNGAFTNTGLYNGNGFAFSGLTAFNNTGLAILNGGSVTAGTYTNAGTIDLGRNNIVGDTYTINGNLVSQNGQYNVDIDLGRNNANGEQLSDRIVVNGDLSGTGTVNFDQQNTVFQLQDNPITVVDVSGTNSATFTATGLPQAGSLIEYDLLKVGDDFAIVSSINPNIGGVAGNVVLVQSLISTVVNRPSTPFVSSLVYDVEPGACEPGVWMRGTGGTGSADGSTTNQLGRSVDASIDLDYWGVQGGADVNCIPMEELGVDFAMGFTGGYNHGDTSQNVLTNGATTSITTSEFDQYYLGGYIAGSKPIGEGVLAADLQFRYGTTDFTFNNVATTAANQSLGLQDAELDSERAAFSGSISYAYPLPYDYSIVPVAGFSYAKTFSSPLIFQNSGVISSLQIDDFETFIGFAGGTLARTIIDEENSVAYRPFVTATAYNDFTGSVRSTVTSSGASQELFSDNIGTFGEVSAGIDTIKLFDGNFGAVKQLNANIRGDVKFSDRVETYSLTGQIRLNF